MSDPFRITGPAVLSISGGRTSAYMLWRVLQAHGGRLPSNVMACFANTGREMPATLDFMRTCGIMWGVPIFWLEYCRWPTGPGVRVVNHDTASRNGEPFAALIQARRRLPGPMIRFCTTDLKVFTIKRFVKEICGWPEWVNVVGLRADEPRRVARALDPAHRKHNALWSNLCPLAEAGIEEQDVLQFWRSQVFNLRTAGPHESNCDGCFLKLLPAIERMLVDHPERMGWWAEQEAAASAMRHRPEQFHEKRDSYAVMANAAATQGRLDFTMQDIEDQALPCEEAACGV